MNDPAAHREVCLWLWQGPAEPPAGAPGRVDLLGRLLEALQRLDHDAGIGKAERTAGRLRIRSALAAADCATYRQDPPLYNNPPSGITEFWQSTEAIAFFNNVCYDLAFVLRDNPASPVEAMTWGTIKALYR